MRADDQFDVQILLILPVATTDILKPSIIRLGILLLLFDVYLTWARIEKQVPSPDSPESSNFGRLAQQPIVYQYIFFRKTQPIILYTSPH